MAFWILLKNESMMCFNLIYTQDIAQKVYDSVKEKLMEQTYDMIANVGYGVHIICQVIDDLK